MLMIVVYHLRQAGNYTFETFSISQLEYYFLAPLGNVGNGLYILLSGYFLIESKKASADILNKAFKLYLQVWFYSVSLAIVICLIRGNWNLSAETLLRILFPVTGGGWWFVSTYLCLFLLHPILNRILRSLTKEQYQSLLLCLFALWFLVPFALHAIYQRCWANSFCLFVFYYALAGYIRIFGLNQHIRRNQWIGLGCMAWLLLFGISLVIFALGEKWTMGISMRFQFTTLHNPLLLFVVISIFMTFLEIRLPYIPWINTLVATTFGVYLIHAHGFASSFLWHTIFTPKAFQDSWLFLPYALAVGLLVFGVCSVIEMLRQRTVERLYIRALPPLSNFLAKQLNRITDTVCRIFF